MSCRNVFLVGRDIAVGTATRYGLHGPGIESRLWRDFSKPVQTNNGYRVFPGVAKRPGRDDYTPHLEPRLKKE